MITRNLNCNLSIKKRRETLPLGISPIFGIEKCQNVQTSQLESIICQPYNQSVSNLIKMPLDSSS
jgi:hypothetical protein